MGKSEPGHHTPQDIENRHGEKLSHGHFLLGRGNVFEGGQHQRNLVVNYAFHALNSPKTKVPEGSHRKSPHFLPHFAPRENYACTQVKSRRNFHRSRIQFATCVMNIKFPYRVTFPTIFRQCIRQTRDPPKHRWTKPLWREPSLVPPLDKDP